jgi:hypothetical protein
MKKSSRLTDRKAHIFLHSLCPQESLEQEDGTRKDGIFRELVGFEMPRVQGIDKTLPCLGGFVYGRTAGIQR